ncbi:MAG: PQQ-binding-like beta-propeller repeat protein [Acidimicrobiia bacterium]
MTSPRPRLHRLFTILPMAAVAGLAVAYFGAIEPLPLVPATTTAARTVATPAGAVPAVFQARGGPGRSGVESLTALLEVPDSRARLAMGDNLGPAVARQHIAFIGIHEHVRALDLGADVTAWTAGLGGQVSTSPVIVGELVVAMSGDTLHGLDFSNGDQRWSRALSPGSHSPLALGSVLYVGGADGVVRAIDSAVGAELWAKEVEGPLTGPLASDGRRVIAVTGSGSIIAFDPDGLPLWTQTVAGVPVDGPVVADGVVYVASGRAMYALDVATGDLGWSVDVGSDIVAAPAVAYGLAYLSTDLGEVVAINAALGREVWRHQVFQPVAGSPMVFGDTVVVLGEEGRMAALDAARGGCQVVQPQVCSTRWQAWIPGSPSRNSALIRVGDSYILNTPPFILVFGA